ncbi:hypothetical protein ES708_20593 [subsurface metagenome]
MTEKSSFFGGTPPPEYNQTEIAEYFKVFFTNGVFKGILNDLEIVASEPPAMTIEEKTGKSRIEGFGYYNDTQLVKNISAADPTNPRIDRAILRLDTVTNLKISCEIKEGTPAVDPVPPDLTQTASTYEILLARIYVGANATSITSDNITDERDWVKLKGKNSIDNDRISVTDTKIVNLNADKLDDYNGADFLRKAESIGNITTRDHHLLTGLGDDDHSIYYNSARHTKAVHDALAIVGICTRTFI